jgi:hypothetical protein
VIIGAIDPGVHVGWCLLDTEGPRFLRAGVIHTDQVGIKPAILALRGLMVHASIVAVEVVEHVNHRPGFGCGMATSLVLCGRFTGRLVQALEFDHHDVWELQSETVKRHWFDRPSVDAQAVRVLVEGRIAGWPRKLPGLLAKHAGHARDAGAVGAYVAAMAHVRGAA